VAQPREGRTPLPPLRRSLLRSVLRALEQVGALRVRLERAREHSAALDTAFATIERDFQVGGGILAGALAYRLFLFALPLAFFLVAGLGLLADLLDRNPETVGENAGFAGVVTQQVASAASGSWNWWVAITSFVVLAYVTRVLLRALAIVHALVWERSAASVKVSSRSLGAFAMALVGQLVLVGIVGLVRQGTSAGGLAVLPLFLLGVAAIWLGVSLQLPHQEARWTDLIPGSLVYALGVLCVQVFNAYLLGRLLESKSGTYGALGAAAAVLLGLFLIGRVVVASAVLNATLFDRRRDAFHPGESG
jgi:uncharacterized BrkB/YihY/UPF0761 family membrane protein